MKATAPQAWDPDGWIASPRPPRRRDIARCRYCKDLISFPNKVDDNGDPYPYFDRNVWRDGKVFWHEDCVPDGDAS